MGDDGDDSLDIAAMGAHVDRFGNIDATFLLGLRVHRLHGEEDPREDSDRAAKGGDPDHLGHHRQSQTGTLFPRFLKLDVVPIWWSQIVHRENPTALTKRIRILRM